MAFVRSRKKKDVPRQGAISPVLGGAMYAQARRLAATKREEDGQEVDEVRPASRSGGARAPAPHREAAAQPPSTTVPVGLVHPSIGHAGRHGGCFLTGVRARCRPVYVCVWSLGDWGLVGWFGWLVPEWMAPGLFRGGATSVR